MKELNPLSFRALQRTPEPSFQSSVAQSSASHTSRPRSVARPPHDLCAATHAAALLAAGRRPTGSLDHETCKWLWVKTYSNTVLGMGKPPYCSLFSGLFGCSQRAARVLTHCQMEKTSKTHCWSPRMVDFKNVAGGGKMANRGLRPKACP